MAEQFETNIGFLRKLPTFCPNKNCCGNTNLRRTGMIAFKRKGAGIVKDWRLIPSQETLKNAKLYKIRFPNFWKESYATKNEFFRLIKDDAEQFVKERKCGEEYLKDEKIGAFWHAHCEFCTQKITTSDDVVCFCTEDFTEWICQDCFNDFREKFEWKVCEK